MDNEITGAVISRRKAGDKIAIWNKNNDNEAAILGIGYALSSLFFRSFAALSLLLLLPHIHLISLEARLSPLVYFNMTNE